MRISAIIPAAGCGARAGFSKNKLLMPFPAANFRNNERETVLEHTVSVFLQHPLIDEIIVASSADDLATVQKLFADVAQVRVIQGGDTRTQSVQKALAASGEPDYVLIHDGARPFVTHSVLQECIRTVQKYGSAVCALPAIDTVVLAKENEIDRVPDRDEAYLLQTPQAFSYAAILAAYRRIQPDETFTDDSGVYAKYCGKPHLFTGDIRNKKLTIREDFFATPRIGVGIDTHAFGKKTDYIVLGGVRIPSDSGLIAHSDGDVLLHAVMDALLSAAALPDIGHLLPDTDPAYRNADSMQLLAEVNRRLQRNGFRAYNVSAAIQAQKPRLANFIAKMRENIAKILQIPPDNVGIGAGTNEGLGYIGRGEGITVTAYVSVLQSTSEEKNRGEK